MGSLSSFPADLPQAATPFPRGARLILPAFTRRVLTLIFWIFPPSSMRAT